ncbi:MAG TPA: bifunctional metallophosphatase/5'-nucleotidase [Polyangiaceae bacterium]|nr:bifunctional metallophosphatase/5'-nucleotidase [Polyangiaceae bacterium]
MLRFAVACVAIGLAVPACGGVRGPTRSGPRPNPPPPSASVSLPASPAAAQLIQLKVLGINDFHGQLSSKVFEGRPVGGAAVLASYLRRAAAGMEDRTIIVHAGDLVGASPLDSSLLKDEPAIQFLNTLANAACSYDDRTNADCNVVGTLGNHEFDEGTTELLRLVHGGDSAKGPFIERPWRGARFPYVCANVVDRATRRSFLPPYVIHRVSGVPVAIVGATLATTPSIVRAPGIAGVEFLDEADAINGAVHELAAKGVHAIIVAIHDGLTQKSYTGPTDPQAPPPTGAFLSVLARLDDDVDVVVSGHTHHFTNAMLPNAHGVPILVAQAFAAGTAYDDIDLTIDAGTKDVVAKSARIVTTFADAGVAPDPAVAQIVAKADEVAAPIGSVVLGESKSRLARERNDAGESPLGDLVADAQRVSVDAAFAFVNPGGIRDDLAAGPVTYGELFAVQPFGNTVVKIALSGQQIYDLLNQQWGASQPAGGRMLQVSGLTYTWDSHVAEGGARVVQVRDSTGAPVVRAKSYAVAVNDYMLGGGDNFTVLAQGTNRAPGPVDVKALAEYVKKLPRPFPAPRVGRITKANTAGAP